MYVSHLRIVIDPNAKYGKPCQTKKRYWPDFTQSPTFSPILQLIKLLILINKYISHITELLYHIAES